MHETAADTSLIQQRRTGEATVPLGSRNWLRCAAVASSVLWFGEAVKLFTRVQRRDKPKSAGRA